MHNLDLILTLTLGLSAALIFGYVTQRLGLSPIVGYLFAGVVIAAFPTADIGTWHERTGAPFMWTVQAPHCAMPQPNFVPFRFRTSRITHRRGMSPGTSTVVERPLTFNV